MLSLGSPWPSAGSTETVHSVHWGPGPDRARTGDRGGSWQLYRDYCQAIGIGPLHQYISGINIAAIQCHQWQGPEVAVLTALSPV